MREAIAPDRLRIVPADRATWEDLQTVLGTSDAGFCQCQRYKTGHPQWSGTTRTQRTEALRAQAGCDDPAARSTTGLVAYLDDEPVGYVAVEPRTAYPRLTRTVWNGRSEDPQDGSVWAVTCFAVRTGYRKRGITYALTRATIDFARERGARALEGYPMITQPGKEITWGELHVGSRAVFADAGFTEVHHPSKRRYVMRIDF